MACDTWLADGTFSACPKIFYQLWVIHGLVQETVLPFVFFLLPGASKEIYTRALNELKKELMELPKENPYLKKTSKKKSEEASDKINYHTNLLVDFELA